MKNDPERTIEFEFLRATEGAALAAHSWLGKGEKELGDAAACDAIRGMFDLMDMKGEITIGEGIKDEAPGLFLGEKVGNWNDDAPRFDVALDPVDGTTNLSKGMPNSIACIAAAIPDESGEAALEDIPAFYMDKLAYPEEVRLAWMDDPSLPLSLDAPLEDVIKCCAEILGKEVGNMTVMVLDRPRNKKHIDAVRAAGAKLRMINLICPSHSHTSSEKIGSGRHTVALSTDSTKVITSGVQSEESARSPPQAYWEWAQIRLPAM